jgi:energy-coupling factor transport system permease protein
MSEFEFLRDLPIGQYLPLDTPLKRLDPRTRILGATIFLGGVTFLTSPVALLLSLAVALLAWWFSRIPWGPLVRGWRSAILFLLILALLQVLFRVGEEGRVLLRLWGLVISSSDLVAGVNLILRFSTYITIIGLATSTLSASEITRGSEALLRPLAALHFPVHDFVMVVQVTLRYFPLLAQSAERIAKAQASRGADWRPTGNLVHRIRQVVPLIVPLFVTSLRRAEYMALAMDARGYGSGPTRTSMVELHFRRIDAMILLAITALVVVMFLL